MIPVTIREQVRASQYYNKKMAKRLAMSSKRLDLCAAQIAHIFHLSGSPLVNGKVCLEVGSGWVLSHALILHLLGAKKVIATDILPHAQPTCLSEAVNKAILYIVRDVLSPFCEHSQIRARLDNLLSINRFNFSVLSALGIEYIAPIDLARNCLNVPIDLVYSLSVLEYVPADDIAHLLGNLTRDLRKGGIMIHCIHLEDRGSGVNGLGRSQWGEFFDNEKGLDSRFIYEWRRIYKNSPIAPDSFMGEPIKQRKNLRVTHIGVLSVKK